MPASPATAADCVREVAIPALRAAREHLAATTEYSVDLRAADDRVELVVSDREGDQFRYCLSAVDAAADQPGACPALRVGGSAGERRLACGDCSVERVREDCLEVCRHWLLC